MKKICAPLRSLVALGLVLYLSCAAMAWQESDFSQRKVAAYSFNPPKGSGDLEAQTVIGSPRTYTFRKRDTLLDIARYFDLGYNELQEAYPEVDPWLPPEGKRIRVPTFWVLPASGYQGLVVNIPEMRLYYFPESDPKLKERTVLTFPTGLGREDWPTPKARFRIRGKTQNPTWVIPESIKKERIQEKGWTEDFIPGGRPDNPLGSHRIELTLPLYTIHGTNNPWAIGRLVTHGCIRLYPEDIEWLFARVRPGMPGEFTYQPVKVGVRHGRVYMEVHQDIYGLVPSLYLEAERVLKESGLEPFVDPALWEQAVKERSGVPMDITLVKGWEARWVRYEGMGKEGEE